MEERILEMLSEIRPQFDFHESDDFIEDGYLDSFDVVTLVSDIENEFGIIIDGIDIIPENFSTIESIISLIEKAKNS